MFSSAKQAETHFARGMSEVGSRNYAAAAEAFREAAAADPGYGAAHLNLGSSLAALGRHEEAVTAFRQAIAIDPQFAQAHFNLGASLQMLGMRDEAFHCFVRTVEINPRHEEAYYYLGREHYDAGRLNEALACFLTASDLSPDEADIYTSLAKVLVKLRLPSAAARVLEKALNLNPDDSATRANLMDQLARDCDWDALGPLLDGVEQLGVVGGPVPPFALLTFDDDPGRHRIRSEKYAATNLPAVQPGPDFARPSARPQRLRIGYFSADFHDHATMFLAARMFELHDSERFSIHAFSYGTEQTGAMRQRALKAFDHFIDVREMNDSAVAELARCKGIDIAVDLKGYTEFQRVGIFAYRPAPIQMTYLGYPGTLAVPFMDYLVVDRMVVPDEHRDAYAEKLIYLPHSYQVNDDSRVLPESAPRRSDVGLPDDGFVFCCFNYTYKISPAEFGIWMELLKEVEGSVLWLLASPGNMQTNLSEQMRRAGVDPTRLVIANRVELRAHFTRLQLADLFLDTFNYNAHTTASDALWAGVPVVTKAGKSFSARVAASLLHAVGMSELVTANERDYKDLAVSLAKNPEMLAATRAKLAANRSTTPLFDSALFTRHLEQAYDTAYQRYIDGLGPADIIVPHVL